MGRPDRGSRLARLLYEWLCLLACFSGYGCLVDQFDEPSSPPQRPIGGWTVPQRARDGLDLQTQFEEMLDTVWRCERWARMHDRIDAVTRFEELKSRRSTLRQA